MDREQLLLSDRLKFYYRLAAWLEPCSVLACAFLWYCWYLERTQGTSPIQHLGVRILLGMMGSAGALSSILLLKGMRAYLRKQDTSPTKTKRFWYWFMTLVVLGGSSVHYHLVYRDQIESGEQRET